MIQPFNYNNLQVSKTPVSSGGIKPFDYSQLSNTPTSTIPPITPPSTQPKPGFFADQNLGGIVKNTITGIPKALWNFLGPGQIQDVLNTPEGQTAAMNLTGGDVAKNILPSIGKVALTPVADLVGIFTGGKTFHTIAGDITNIQQQAKDAVQNGENPYTQIIKSVPQSIFDGLMIAGVAEKVFSPRESTIATGVKTNDLPSESQVNPVRSFRLSQTPKTTNTPIPNEALDKLQSEQGVQFKNYDPNNPTYFRTTPQNNGVIKGEIVQIKPSYFDMFKNVFKGDVTKVPPEYTNTVYEKSTSIEQLKNPIPTQNTPIVPPTMLPTSSIKPFDYSKTPSVEVPTTLKTAPETTITPKVGNIPPDLQSLATEAKKYKSAEEFVKAQTPAYHGSPVELKQFHNRNGAFFADNFPDASGFGGNPDHVYEGYLNFKKPLVVDAKGAKWDELNNKYGKSTQEIISNAKKDGYDGIVFKNIMDNIGDTADVGGQSTVSYAYKPKDAFMNESQLTDFYNKAVEGTEEKPIFARKTTALENKSPTAKSRGYNSIPDKNGYNKVYMPYGEKGAGYYYDKITLPKTPEPKQSQITLNAGLDPGLGKTLEQDIIPKGKALIGGVKSIYNEITTLFNPVGKADPKAVDIIMKAKGQFEKEMFRMEQATKKIKNMWDKQPDKAKFDFMAKVESGEPVSKEFQELAKMYRDRLDNAHKAITQFKDIPFIENFFPHFWEKPDAKLSGIIFPKRPLQGAKPFTKQRVFQDIQTGIKAGYTPVSTNPEELVQIYEQNVKKFVMAQQIKAEMIDKVMWKFVKQGQQAPENFARIDDAIARIYYKPAEINSIVQAGEYYAQKDVARLINNYLSKDKLIDTALGRGVMNVKNTLNAFQLGFSAFHLTMETLDTIVTKFSIGVSKIMSGNILSGIKDIVASPITPYSFFRNGQKFFNNDSALKDIEDSIFTGGASFRQRQYYKNTVLDTFLKNAREGNYLGALFRSPMASVEATMRPLFSYYIPRLKVGAFRELYASELERQSQKIQDGKVTQEQIARDTWNNIENRMGELNYDNLFWNRNLKTALMLTFRAVGWNLGTLRELGGGLLQDLPKQVGRVFTKEGRKNMEFTPKMSYTFSLFLVMGMLGAIYQYLHTGKKPQSIKDLYYPKNGAKDKSGEDYRVEFPSYLKDLYQVSHHPIKTIGNKVAPEFSLLLNLLTNKDFYGDYIANRNDNLSTQAKQTALYLLTQLEPFSAQNLSQLNKGTANTEQKIEAFFGIIKAPKEVIQTEYQKVLSNLYSEQVGQSARTPEQKDIQQAKTDARNAIKNGDYSLLDELIKQGILTPKGRATFIKNAKLTSDERMFKGLNKTNKEKVIPLK